MRRDLQIVDVAIPVRADLRGCRHAPHSIRCPR
jgi:hypothetical protein